MRTRLGQGIDPRLGVLDYSGYVRAAEIDAESMRRLGQSIGNAIVGYRSNKKLDKKLDQFTSYLDDQAEEGKTGFLNMIGLSDKQVRDLSPEQRQAAIKEGLSNYGKADSVVLWDSIQGQKIKDGFKKTPMEKKESRIREVVNDPEKAALIRSNDKYSALTDDQLVNQLFVESEFSDALSQDFDLDFLKFMGEDADNGEEEDDDEVDIDLTKPNFLDNVKNFFDDRRFEVGEDDFMPLL